MVSPRAGRSEAPEAFFRKAMTRISERIGRIVNSAERRKRFVADVIQLLHNCLQMTQARPGWPDPEAEWVHPAARWSGKVGGILASILRHYQLKNGEKRPKMGQNRGVSVTDQLTIRFCIVFIIGDLH
jgi:hypothetical protein